MTAGMLTGKPLLRAYPTLHAETALADTCPVFLQPRQTPVHAFALELEQCLHLQNAAPEVLALIRWTPRILEVPGTDRDMLEHHT